MSGEKRTIIFVCTSNTCRSPMAEAFGKMYLQSKGLTDSFEVKSRSITEDYEPNGSPASAQGNQVLLEDYGYDNSAHRSTLISQKDIDEAYALVGVSKGHVRAVVGMFPSAATKMRPLRADVSDPWHMPVQVYRDCANTMKPLVEEAMENLTINPHK